MAQERTQQLEILLSDISSDLVLMDDTSPLEVAGMLRKLQGELGEDSGLIRLKAACEYVLSQARVEDQRALLSQLLSQAQTFLRNPASACFPGEKANGTFENEMADSVDPQFLTEFIEKHLTMMEDFEAAIVDLRYQLSREDTDASGIAETRKDFCAFIKGYIHNVKGDAGSIGLIGVEKICHFVEDILVDVPADSVLDPLLSYKEWVVQCMKCFSSDDPLKESSESFRQRFQAACTQLSSQRQASPAKQDGSTDMPPEANLDLIAELMAEGIADAPKASAPVTEKKPTPRAAPTADDTAPLRTYPVTGDLEVFAEFCVEAEDHLNNIESILLESDGNLGKETIDSIFRGIHSIKGASSYFALKETMETSHVTENLLDEVRDGSRTFDQGLVELVLAYVDLEQNLIRTAKEAVKGDGTMVENVATRSYLKRLKAYEAGEQTPPAAIKPGQLIATAPAIPATSKPAAKKEAVPAAAPAEGEEAGSKSKGEKLDVKNFVKVDTQRLDLLIDSIGEMCIYSSMLIQNCRELLGNHERILKTTHQVEKFSRDLQNIGMSLRLIPIRGLFQKMSRLVWDMSKKMGKEIKFHMHGEETELDRTIIDKLADPLMHMIRNALDHGVEPPEEREQSGKTRQGSITLSAFHSGGSIHIKITDDGRGLNPDKLVKKAIEKGILTENHNLAREDIFRLIFAPGFSTAAVVTDISGRGVGMDVVKRNIESMRGRVHIESEIGRGSTFTIELPLTLAIIDGIQVGVGGESYIIPTLSVIEFMRPAPAQIMRTLERGETYQFRGRYLPVYRLSELFNVEARVQDPEESIFVIVENSGEQVALMVDEIIGTYSTVIKNLGDMFEHGKGVAGCAIMANGDVALILDVRSVIAVARDNYVFQDRRVQTAARNETVSV